MSHDHARRAAGSLWPAQIRSTALLVRFDVKFLQRGHNA
jgi:hypothetical protein